MALQLQLQLQASSTRTHLAPPSPLAPSGNAGLRRPSDRFALKSSFFSSSLSLLLSPNKQQKPLAKAAPKFSMRVASKEAYICRDCGYHFLSFLFVLCLLKFLGTVMDWVIDNYDDKWCRYIYNERTPFAKLPDKYFCPGNHFSYIIS